MQSHHIVTIMALCGDGHLLRASVSRQWSSAYTGHGFTSTSKSLSEMDTQEKAAASVKWMVQEFAVISMDWGRQVASLGFLPMLQNLVRKPVRYCDYFYMGRCAEVAAAAGHPKVVEWCM